MYLIDFKNPVHVHFIGIGGISMSGLAEILKHAGFSVTGSDRDSSPLTEKLSSEGIAVAVPQSAENIARFSPIDLIVYTAAVHPDNPEFAEGARREIPMITRAELLGQIMKQYEDSVAVAGTHGKTTTTSMLSQILVEADRDPTLSIGAMFPAIGGNLRIGSSGTFVAEACEYTNSFLSLYPKISIILDIEEDHLDFFKDLADIRTSFRRFASQTAPDGAVVIGSDIEDLPGITAGLPCSRVITFGLEETADVRATNIRHDRLTTTFTVHLSDSALPAGSTAARDFPVTLHVPGDHNVKNALAAIAAALLLGLDDRACARALERFAGAARRFERLGVVNGVTIIDDYAHHPTEIRMTLAAARDLGFKRIWCAFQPHTYTRTKALFSDFAEALTGADRVVLADIYAARETDDLGISSRDLQEKIRNLGHSCDYFPSFSEIRQFLSENCEEGDLLIFMGAGEIDKIGFSLLSGE
ncbi:MAG: UDP-N-acetylmuramate--L-alanine ligase [Lachnospiraceae bacterium]|nr:UDP-N-acetylmuramate--L-alanine ligase [Lachnospiraceae bacterium]